MLLAVSQALFGNGELTREDVAVVMRVYRGVLGDMFKRYGHGKRFLLKWYWCY